MKCLYINLDRATERRQALEANIAAIVPGSWTFERLAAVDGATASLPAGKRRPTEIACLLSHLAALERAAALSEPTLIVEDDCQFHRQSLIVLEHYLPTLPPDSWDLLFLDITVPNAENMVKLFLRRRKQSKGEVATGFNGALDTVELRSMNFAGALAYLVTPEIARQLAQTLRGLQSIDQPYDMLLRDLVHRRQLRAKAIFPFLTTSSTLGDQSSIQPDKDELTEASWSSFRRMMWIGASAGDDTPSRRRATLPDSFVDPQAAALADLLAVCLSKNFARK